MVNMATKITIVRPAARVAFGAGNRLQSNGGDGNAVQARDRAPKRVMDGKQYGSVSQ